MAILTLKFVTKSFLLSCIFGIQISEAQRNNFTVYLEETIKNYSSWLIENQRDPSAPIREVLKIKTYPTDIIVLDCELRNQQVRGHSVASVTNVEAGVHFNSNYFEVARELNDTIGIYGDFSCLGKVDSLYFPELNRTDLYFSGEGNFSVKTNSSAEFISYVNVGITENYTFDFEHSYTDFGAFANISQRELVGNWNVSLTPYMSQIRNEFFDWFKRSLDTGKSEEKQQASPLYRLLREYMDSKTKNIDLRNFLAEDELPDPFTPTPTPTTTPEPTTEMTETQTIPLSTGTSNTDSTTAESTTKVDSASALLGFHSCIQIMLCMHLLFRFIL